MIKVNRRRMLLVVLALCLAVASQLVYTSGIVTATTPTVVTTSATNIAARSATLTGRLDSKGTATSVVLSFEWGPVIGTADFCRNTATVTRTSVGTFTATISGLNPVTQYHFRAKAVGGGGTSYGSDLTFTTTDTAGPTVLTTSVTNVAAYSATLNGLLDSLGSATLVWVSFELGTDTSYGNTTTEVAKTSVGTFAVTISTLWPGRLYHFRAKVVSGDGTSYGSDMTFTPPDITEPTVSTNSVTNVTAHAATLSGRLDSLGSSGSVWVTFEWGKDTSYGTTTPIVTKTSTGVFAATISGLVPSTTYHFRAKADRFNLYGSDITFTTADKTLATVSSPSAIKIAGHSATLSATLSSLGSANTARVRFSWGQGTSTIGCLSPEVVKTGPGPFSMAIRGLTPGTTYSFMAIAYTPDGETFSSDVSFTTIPATLPHGEAVGATVGATTVTLTGSLSTLGSAQSVKVWFAWGPMGSGELFNTAMVTRTSTGTFTTTILRSNLIPGTSYHFILWVWGDVGTGTGFGPSMNFSIP